MTEIEIYDCTLREGEQAAGAFFSLQERVKLFEILDNFHADFIEVGWPMNEEVLEAFEECRKIRKRAKISAFGSTAMSNNIEQDKNLLNIISTKADYACIFGKTHLQHVEKQLKINKEENLERIKNSIKFLINNRMKVFYDAEHYFDAFKENKDYALLTIKTALDAGAERIILCDTNGGILPDEAEKIIIETEKIIGKEKLGVHFHNDCNLALANTLICLPYVKQVQGTINGIGERIGNLNFSEFLPVMKKTGRINLDLKKLKEVNETAFKLAGIEIPETRAFIGNTAFSHKGGVHIDATNKGASYEHANPEDYGNKRVIVMNSLGGAAGIISVAEQFGYFLDKKDEKVRKKIEELFIELREMEIKGYRHGAIKAEQFLLIEKYFGKLKESIELEKWKVETEFNNGKEKSKFSIFCKIDSRSFYDTHEIAGGPVDAAYKTILNLAAKKYPEIKNLKLIDFHVSIARSLAEESSVRTIITFSDKNEEFQTIGVDNNLIESAIEAITKACNYYLNRFLNNTKLK